MAVHPLDAVGGAEALEPVPLDHAGEAPALARADHVDPRDLVEHLDGLLPTCMGRTVQLPEITERTLSGHPPFEWSRPATGSRAPCHL